MTHFERLFGALYVSEVWSTSWLLNPRRIYFKARAVVVFDRVLCNDPRIEDKT